VSAYVRSSVSKGPVVILAEDSSGGNPGTRGASAAVRSPKKADSVAPCAVVVTQAWFRSVAQDPTRVDFP